MRELTAHKVAEIIFASGLAELVAGGMEKRKTLQRLFRKTGGRFRVSGLAARDDAGMESFERESVRLESAFRKIAGFRPIVLAQRNLRKKRECGCAVFMTERCEPETFLRSRQIPFRERGKACYVVCFSVVGIDGKRTLCIRNRLVITRLTRRKSRKCAKRRKMVGILFKRSLEERTGIVVGIARTEFLNALYEESLRGIPVEVLRHLYGTRLDIHLRSAESVAGTHKSPRFVKTVRSARHERRNLERRLLARRTRLLEDAARLQFGILTVAVGKQVFPNGAFARRGPQPDFAPVFLVGGVSVHGAERHVRPPKSEKARIAVQDVIGFVAAEIVLGIDIEIVSFGILGPHMSVATMADVISAGKNKLRILRKRKRRIHPMVVRTFKI